MYLHRLYAIIVCANSLCAAELAQEPRAALPPVSGVQPFRATISGTCTNKDDFSFTGTPAGLAPGQSLRIYCVVAGRSTGGFYTAQILAEEQVSSNPCASPGGPGLEAVVKGYLIVLSFAASEDQLFLKLSSSETNSQCLTAPGTVAPGKGALDVLGGTGRYQGATGTLSHVITPIALTFSALGGDGFLSAFSGTLDGTITLK
ncbi:MAG: hypothetical protein HY820_27660 [Acidobacteria bacterium]|nr:hypothetical protein [Acidobacteriota bacterium]